MERLISLLDRVAKAVEKHPTLNLTHGPYQRARFEIHHDSVRVSIFVETLSGRVTEIWADETTPEGAVEEFEESLDFWARVLN